ncbi:type II secretion system protein [Alkalibacillus salilacus]|uniref:Type IV pilus assembly protein PilA n=1 Tax=Alkalibacillus salilacus TaxID=284582 RepID=A0ABT9VG33_9BACI|nr:prepilin-type N-terminal cleavage/methylation domain-containing protein [Alkalibacillus salilacus]MDQ0159815.1 type IV pilus assembly protein PilA [Alkalibacillus salilacus]
MFKRIFKNQKGITLVELLAVIVILGIIALIAVPAIAGVIEDSRYDSVKSTAINVIEAAELYATTNDVESVGVEQLASSDYIDNSTFTGTPTVSGLDGGQPTISGEITMSDVTINFDGESVSEVNDMERN